MEINTVHGVNAYTGNTLNSEKSQVESQNQASARSDVSPQEARNAQMAFEVNISQEARQLTAESDTQTGQQTSQQAGQTAQPTQEPSGPAAETPASGPGQEAAARQQASQIVNIVA